MASFSYVHFEKTDAKHWKAQPAKLNASGKGKMVFLDYSDGPVKSNKFAGPRDMRQMWAIRPASLDNGELKDNAKFNLELEITPENKLFLDSINNLDQFVMKTALENKDAWFGAKNASKIDSVDALRLTYTKTVIEGKPNRNGGKYNDSIRMKIEGNWGKYMNEVVFKDDDPNGMPKECTWHPRMVNTLDPSQDLKDNETMFFLYMNKDPVSGIDNYADRVPVIDAAGHQIKDNQNNGLWRYVGPQDCKPNSRITVIFTASRVWISDVRFGITIAAKKVYIKPPPPKVTQVLEGVRTLTSVDIATASRAVLNTLTAEDASDNEEFDFEQSNPPAQQQNPSPQVVQQVVQQQETHHEEESNVSPSAKRRKTTTGKSKPILINDPL